MATSAVRGWWEIVASEALVDEARLQTSFSSKRSTVWLRDSLQPWIRSTGRRMLNSIMSDVTQILQRIETGDRRASSELLPLVYLCLCQLESASFREVLVSLHTFHGGHAAVAD